MLVYCGPVRLPVSSGGSLKNVAGNREEDMQVLLPLAGRVAEKLKARGETLAIAESSAGGLVSAAMLSVSGASAYFLGGAVVYTADARSGLLGIEPADLEGFRPSTERYATLMAETVRTRLGAVWGLGETGATGPSGNRYGDAAGHACIAIAGPSARSITIETQSGDRQANMRAFANAALETLLQAIEEA